ncbi:hypothetical protein O3M35_002118 [Rhynocoris fuscipes]|uniref:AB hydrolase-1 domain-containing protein n=1 Tax=Rhynocoris fuscipes TaxID=488301 RepID=A0AAW1CRC4_9HEMI
MFLRNIKLVTTLFKRSLATNYQEKQLLISGKKINYLKVGEGPSTVLCLPGLLGTLWTDFPNQIQYINKSLLTLICMDMPGCGGSRPPNRSFPADFYKTDAEFAANLMKSLNISRYGVMGWSDGGISALVLAARYPENVSKLAVWGANAYVSSNDVSIYQGIRDIDKWSPKMVEPFLAAYGRDMLKNAMNEWCKTLESLQKEGGNICKDELSQIIAPTLIIHGDKDPLVPLEHPLFLNKEIKNSKLVRFPNGKHNVHLRYYKEFNELVEKFFTEN